jgi:hypothetical protein
MTSIRNSLTYPPLYLTSGPHELPPLLSWLRDPLIAQTLFPLGIEPPLEDVIGTPNGQSSFWLRG